MVVTLPHTSTVSARLTSLIYGALMSTIVLATVPGLHSPSWSGMAEQSTTVDATPVPTPAPAKKHVARLSQSDIAAYLARDWNLEHQYAAQVASAVLSSSARHGIDPFLLMAVAAAESSLQHSVGNPGGGADPMKPFGIMQVAGQYHVEKFPGGAVKRTSLRENFDIGAWVLAEYLALEDGNERRALLRYNGTLHVSDKYFRKVNKLKQRLYRGIQGMRGAANSDKPT